MNKPDVLHRMERQVAALERTLTNEEAGHIEELKLVRSRHLLSAKNLIHYSRLRCFDLRKLQHELSQSAISSHGHAEGYTLHNLHNIHYLLNALLGKTTPFPSDVLNAATSKYRLKSNKEALFGKAAQPNYSRIMVTIPAEVVKNPELIGNCIKAGMDVARINTAHDDEQTWMKMIRNIKAQSKKQNKKILIYMDLAGPKLRITVNAKGGQIYVEEGDQIIISAKNGKGDLSIYPSRMLSAIQTGQQIWFDDGKIGGVISSADENKCLVTINHAADGGAKLKSEKGFNLPDTAIELPALTERDLTVLPFVVSNADMLGYSFVRKPEDVHQLYKELDRLQRTDIGVILKIENREAFNNLPSLLLAAMRFKSPGIMIARGDLAVEMGMLRLAEVQEEILWMAEAAHIPVIWATQVFEQLLKKGKASRAEISDAVNAVRAECIMLNKGPYITRGIQQLRLIDKTMMAHEDKKQSHLRPLHMAQGFVLS